VVSLIRPGGGQFTPVLGGQFERFFHSVPKAIRKSQTIIESLMKE
jgi:hypothetical protein